MNSFLTNVGIWMIIGSLIYVSYIMITKVPTEVLGFAASLPIIGLIVVYFWVVTHETSKVFIAMIALAVGFGLLMFSG